MTRTVYTVLAGLGAALLIALGALWVGDDLSLRDARWTPPAPLPPDVQSTAPVIAGAQADAGRFRETLERPLFSPTRRPPPPAAVAAAPAVAAPDPLAGLRLYGVFQSGDGGGVIVGADGDVSRVRVGEKIGDWTVQGIRDRSVTLVRGGETRSLQLAYSNVDQVAPAVTERRAPPAAAPRPGAAPVAPAVAAPTTPDTRAAEPAANPRARAAPTRTPSFAIGGSGVARETEAQARERLARRNAARAERGLPPVRQ